VMLLKSPPLRSAGRAEQGDATVPRHRVGHRLALMIRGDV
jgi:hypothetical protein